MQKDILLRFNLNLDNCRGQTYDGASNIMGKHSGVATQILAEQAKAIATHCFGHSLSLAVKSLTSDCNILRCTMGTVGEICILVKYSPKREQLLGKLSENIEGEVKEISGSTPGKLDKLSEENNGNALLKEKKKVNTPSGRIGRTLIEGNFKFDSKEFFFVLDLLYLTRFCYWTCEILKEI